jgi:hypothetical protein
MVGQTGPFPPQSYPRSQLLPLTRQTVASDSSASVRVRLAGVRSATDVAWLPHAKLDVGNGPYLAMAAHSCQSESLDEIASPASTVCPFGARGGAHVALPRHAVVDRIAKPMRPAGGAGADGIPTMRPVFRHRMPAKYHF